jgi:hypothetical protein
MKQALKISVEGGTEVLDLDAPEGSLKVLQTAVGGLIQPIAVGNLEIVINEEGKIFDLPLNNFGTRIFRKAYDTSDYIVGDIVVVAGVDEEGEWVGLTDEQVSQYTYLAELNLQTL